MSRLRDFRTYTAILIAVPLLASCSGDDAKVEPKPEPFKKSVTHTHDGALPLAVVNSYEQQWRAGNAEVTCGFLSTVGQAAAVERAAGVNLVSKKATCEKAVEALQDLAADPARVELIDIPTALDDTAEIVLHRADKTEQIVTLSTDETGAWLIDSIKGYKVAKGTDESGVVVESNSDTEADTEAATAPADPATAE